MDKFPRDAGQRHAHFPGWGGDRSKSLRTNLKASALIGAVSLAAPFVRVWTFAQHVLGWSLRQSQIALWVQHALPHYPETVGEIEEEKHAASAFLSKITRQVAANERK